MLDHHIPQTDADWLAIIDALQTYTRQLVRGKYWFRGKQTEVYLEGKEINDYVYEAIGRFLRYPKKFDPAKGTLIDYLQLNLIRGLVANDGTKAENKTTVDIFGRADQLNEENGDSSSYLNAILPCAEAFFDQEIDYAHVITYLGNRVKNDSDVENLFYGFSLGMDRGDILKEFNMTEKDYMNAYRRYQTVKKQTIIEFDLKPHKS